jgi:catechol 2,3-dioxygenase-like lactoylglutathione lyase family enzyme
MQTKFGHIVIHCQPKNLGFYKDLFTFLGWSVLYEEEGTILGVGTEDGSSLWFGGSIKPEVSNDYDGPGMNHLGIQTTTQSEVDETVTYLQEKGITALFETPRHRPEFSSPGNTYYQVMFESPDRVLFEVVYIGPKA